MSSSLADVQAVPPDAALHQRAGNTGAAREGRERTLRFEEIQPQDDSLVGGKGAGLARLVRAEFPVPPGFVITTSVYQEFLTQSGILNQLQPLLDVIDYRNMAQLEEQAARIRELIIACPIPDPVQAEIAQSYRLLGKDAYVAVRSSGTAEDTANASFAGLHDTYLHIKGESELVTAVRRCWASMWTGRAVSYRKSTGFEHLMARIAVVVQVMVESDLSGVMFTANPLNARTDELIINASWGLGEGIVSGIVVPDEVTLSHAPMRVKRCVVGSKEVQVVRNPDSGIGTVTAPVADARRTILCMADDDAVRLGQLGLRVMVHHGGVPQDLEWAIAAGKIYLLQSRPITGIEFTWDEDLDAWQKAPEDDDTIWSGGWAAEFWSGAITPLFYSIRSREIWTRNEHIYRLLGFDDLLDFRLLKYRRATAFYNVELDTRLYSRLLPRALRGGALGYHPPNLREKTANEPMHVGLFIKAMARVYMLSPSQSIQRWERTLREFSRDRIDHVKFASREELRTWSDEAVRKYAKDWSNTASEFLERTSLGVYVYSKFTLGMMRWMVANWSQDPDPFTFQDMISGLPVHTLMAGENRELWYLAQEIRHSPTLTALFHRHPGPAFLEAATGSEEGKKFVAKYRDFVQRHGHRGHADRDIYFTRRVEDPNLDIESFALLLKAVNPVTPEELEERLVRRREETSRRVINQIRETRFGGLKAFFFNWVHAWVLKFLVMRDDWRHSIDRVTLAKKWGFQELGLRAVDRGLLDDKRDFYFLSEQELYDLLDHRAPLGPAKMKLAARQRVFDKFLARSEVPPPFLRGSTPAELDETADSADLETLKGTAISRGVVRGRARVIAELRDIGRIAPDEILVCNSTDPAWAPVFPVISGLVLEMGGMLSHGACLSREFGLPAVQIRNAMQRIENGALIEVSGDAGRVRILESAAKSADSVETGS